MLVKCEVNGRVTEENNVVSVSDKQNFIDLLDLDLSEFEKQFDLIESEPVKDHSQILFSLYEQIDEVDFRNEAGFLNDDQKLLQKHFLVTCVEKILETADKNNWGVCRNHNFIYLYNGEYWSCVESQDFQIFLGKAAEKMGVYKFDARLYTFRRQLLQQFLSVSRLPKPQQNDNSVLINLKNGTFEIDGNKMHLRKPDRNDFLTYQLPFPYDEKAVVSYL
jgi:putative DNA primase/helicase